MDRCPSCGAEPLENGSHSYAPVMNPSWTGRPDAKERFCQDDWHVPAKKVSIDDQPLRSAAPVGRSCPTCAADDTTPRSNEQRLAIGAEPCPDPFHLPSGVYPVSSVP